MIPNVCTVVLYGYGAIRQGLEVLARCHYTAIPVLDAQDRYIGSVTEGDFLRHILKTGTTDRKEQESYSVSDILRRDVCPALFLPFAALEAYTGCAAPKHTQRPPIFGLNFIGISADTSRTIML